MVDLLEWATNTIEARRARNLDTYWVWYGPEGWGKSSGSLQVALALKPDLKPRDVIFDHEDYMRVYDPEARDKVYVFDEFGRLFFNRNWNSRKQRNLIQEVMENRANRNVYLLNGTRYKTLDNYMRDGRVELRTMLLDQGKALLQRQRYNAFTEESHYVPVFHAIHWSSLEEARPDWAPGYYKRKSERHAAAFHRRKGRLNGDMSEKELAALVKEGRKNE